MKRIDQYTNAQLDSARDSFTLGQLYVEEARVKLAIMDGTDAGDYAHERAMILMDEIGVRQQRQADRIDSNPKLTLRGVNG